MSRTTEIALVTGERIRVEGDVKEVEGKILAAARGSIMELAWMIQVITAEPVGVNPEHVVMLRGVDPEPGA